MVYFIVAVVIVFLIFACDMRLKTVHYEVESEKIEKPVRFALITDLHSCRYGKDEKRLIEAIDREKPDIVLLGGDIFESWRSVKNPQALLEDAAKKYPCFYAAGNHEFRDDTIIKALNIVKSNGVKYLSGGNETLSVREQLVTVGGIDDPYSGADTKKQIADAINGAQGFSVLISHRPELTEMYRESGFDMVVAGHAHGGQWRIPGILNGVLAPHQGFFPKYAGGKYQLGDTALIVSRGLSRENVFWVPRIFNRPELVIIDAVPKRR